MESNKIVFVKYQTRKESCTCCGRGFEEADFGEERQYEISIDNVLNWADWDLDEADEDMLAACEEDTPQIVEEYIYDTINFYALKSNEILRVQPSELQKVKDLVLQQIKKRKDTLNVNNPRLKSRACKSQR